MSKVPDNPAVEENASLLPFGEGAGKSTSGSSTSGVAHAVPEKMQTQAAIDKKLRSIFMSLVLFVQVVDNPLSD